MIRLIILASVILISSVSGHQDTKLEIKGNLISGLPERYRSAKFVENGKALLINGKKLKFPAVINRMLSLDPGEREVGNLDPFAERVVDLSRLELQASWYHFPSRLPPYLSIRNKDDERGLEFAVLIDLEDVSIIEANISVRDSAAGWVVFPVIVQEPSIPDPAPVSLDAIIGMWRDNSVQIELTPTSIKTTDIGEPPIALSGKISSKEPGIFIVEHPDGNKTDVNFSLDGDILTLWWGHGRSGILSVVLAKKGGKTDTLYRSLIGADIERHQGNEDSLSK